MDNETLIGIVIGKVRDALGSAVINNNIERQVRQQTLDEIALREKYSTQAKTNKEPGIIEKVKGSRKS